MGNDMAVRPHMIARVNAGAVLAAFLLLAEAMSLPTQCSGHDISIAGNGRPTGGAHEGRASPTHRRVFGDDASHRFAFGFLEFDRTPDPTDELTHISENAP